MAYTTGEATSYKDLLVTLKDFAVASGWTCLRHAQGTGDEPDELILRSSGTGAEQVFVGMATEANSAGGRNWRLQGFTGFSPELTFDAQPGAYGDPAHCPRLCLLDAGLRYWLFVSARRIIVVAKASTTYQIGYLGLILPYGPPSSLPYPLLVGGCGCMPDAVWSAQTDSNTPFYNASFSAPTVYARPDFSSGLLLLGQWRNILHRWKRASDSSWTEDRTLGLWPWSLPAASSYYATFATLRGNLDGSLPLLPAILCAGAPNRNLYGELDGMRAVPGYGVAAEDTITTPDGTYIVFSGSHTTDRAAFVAVRQE
ncbi:hypothetical protein GGQ74_000073 [Desulfobaculum xiamenense]|uniref:Uncharacterized protein n=1 Tax=Desulfobaculum xiamenense TaxID=995050 RepID=A0A846QJT2_9BACT|nr:hypothetical protein [Desulfobaculum xiamenense]NJB66433.1 hypothetical protein [Desulfobaculum xiamenense]